MTDAAHAQPANDPQAKPQRQKREVQVVYSKGFGLKMEQLAKMEQKERRQYLRRNRIEVFVTDLRDQTVGIVHETFGRHEGALYEVYERGGPHHRTLAKWESGETFQPRLETIRRALLVCGKDLGIVG